MERKKDEIRGETLRKLRKERNLTQQQVADFMGLSKQAISKFEQGISYSLDTAHAFAKFYNVDYDFLMKNTRIGKIAQPMIDKIEEQNEIISRVLGIINPQIESLENKIKVLEEKVNQMM